MQPKRKLKVRRAFREKVQPTLILEGEWLAHAGFLIGDLVDIQVQHQQLIIRPVTSGEESEYTEEGIFSGIP